MLAGKCDRCGKFYDLNGQITAVIEKFNENITTHQQKNCEHFELCPDCVAEFDLWVKDEGEVTEY